MMVRLLPLALLAAPALSAQEAPIQVPPAPEMVPGQFIAEFVPGDVRCESGSVAVAHLETPFPVMVRQLRDAKAGPITYTFRIDAAGRPLGIAGKPMADWDHSLVYFTNPDLQPALAASRFAAAAPQTGCQITFQPRIYPVQSAPLALARRYFVAPHSRQDNERALFARLHPADTNCIGGGAPRVRMRAYPDFEAIPVGRGSWTYAMTAFDIDAQGVPVNVAIVGSDGDAALERASIEAVGKSRFAPEARHGCTYPYYRRSSEPLPAPPAPDEATLAPPGARCPGKTDWASMPKLDFPSGFERRQIEGWAVIAYDVAPWGQTGNVRVLAAEPAAQFGEQARGIVMRARQAPAADSRTGCVDTVRFVMTKRGAGLEAQPGREE